MAANSGAELPPPLVGSLTRCVEICEQTLDRYVAQDDTVALAPFGSALVLAAAALKRVADADAAGGAQPPLRQAAAEAARAAAETTRQHGLDEQLLRCAEALERAAFLCDRAQGAGRSHG